MMRTRSALILSVMPLFASCSLAFAKGPPSGTMSAGAPDDVALASCNPTPTWGFVDTALSVAALASGYVASYGHLAPDEDRGEHIVAGGIAGALFGIGASVGFKRANACEDFLDRLAGRAPGRAPIRLVADQDRRPDAWLITAEELIEGVDATLMAAVQRLRPQWLRRTGARNTLPAVIVDNQTFELDLLDAISPDDVEWLRFVQPFDATTRWGTGFPSGAIEVRTFR